MIRTITQTAKVGKPVHIRLDAFLRQQTELWNVALQERQDCYKKTGRSISYYEQQKSLTKIRKDPEFSQYHAQTQRSALRRIDEAFQAFFRRVKAGEKPGYPRLKSRHRGVHSFDVPDPRFNGNSIRIKGIGTIRFKELPEGKTTMVRIIKSALRVSIQFVVKKENTCTRKPHEPIGVDLGLKDRAILSSGMTLDAGRIDRRTLKRLQRKLSRAEKGSNSRRKKVMALRREWERVRIIEHDELHRATSEIMKSHNCIAVENLQIDNMVKNHNLARAIMEQQWGKFVDMLAYKAESAGGEVVRVAPHNTSTDCSVCGHRQKMPLHKRRFDCGGCGVSLDRDVNASRNILKQGYLLAGWEMGQESALPGAPENVRKDVMVNAGGNSGKTGQDAEQYVT